MKHVSIQYKSAHDPLLSDIRTFFENDKKFLDYIIPERRYGDRIIK
jgi:hypothetical protein